MKQAEHEHRAGQIAAYEKQLRLLAEQQFAVSLMNNTKWRELVASVQGLAGGGFRVKFIDEIKIWETDWIISPSPSYVEGQEFGPMLFLAVEWLEILFITPHDNTAVISITQKELYGRLQAYNISFSEEAGTFRITGYGRR